MARPQKPKRTTVQSWTRCRIPKNTPLPHEIIFRADYQTERDSWQTSLRLLAESPGFHDSICGRDMGNEENVLFITTWDDEASLQAFIQSEAYPAYFMAFFGQSTPPSPSAFFTIQQPPFLWLEWGVMTIWTFSFSSPVKPEDREIFRTEGLNPAKYSSSGLGLRNQSAWVREEQILTGARTVEQGILVQKWPSHLDRELISNDPFIRQRWNEQIEEMNPLHVEEVTWFIGPAESEREAPQAYISVSNQANDIHEDGNDDYRNQQLASTQLLSTI